MKNKNTEPTLYLFKKMWKFSEGNKKNVIIFMIFFVISNIILLFQPILFWMFLNELQNNWLSEKNITYVISILLWMFWIWFIFWFFHWIGRIIENKNAFLVKVNYKKYLFEKVLDFDLNWHNDKQSWNTIDKIEKATKSLNEFWRRIFRVIGVVIKAIGTILVLLYFNIWISVWVLLFIIFWLYILFQFDKRLIPLYKKNNLLENIISAKIYDSLSNITSIIILNIKKIVNKDVSKNLLLPKEVYYKNVVLNELKWFVWDIIFRFITILPLIFYIWYNYQQKSIIEIWTISALYLYLSNLSSVFFGFADLYSQIIVDKTNIENAEIIEYSQSNKVIKKEEIKKLKNLEIVNLNFSYENIENKKDLENINLKITSWEKIALIWQSGSWKTTFLKLIHWLYNSSWKVIIDNKKEFADFTKIDLKTTLVPQEPELFTASIKENIAFWLDYTDEEIKNFTDMSCFSEVVEKLPQKTESKINEKWVNLSWWQKQRLALARALLFAENKKIILLDESTSSVDPENEEKIYKNIFNNFNEKTIISTIHKMNLLKYFDRIIMFENWKIIDDGNFQYLLKNNKNFSKMWEDFREEK